MRPQRFPFRSSSARLLLCGLLLSPLACRAKKAPAPAPAPRASQPPPPIDHLAPGELAPSKQEVYGFAIPKGMTLESQLPDRAFVRGRISPEALANYVRARVAASHVEIGAARTVFPRVYILGGSRDRVFSFEVVPDGASTRLIITDVTPPPPPPPGLTPEERWRAAGLTPEGKPLDLKKLE